MKVKELTQKIKEIIEKHNINQFDAEDYAEYSYYGIRFEDKDREVGEKLDNSKHNMDREDEREFPEYASDKYGDMYTLDGTSAWYIAEDGSFDTSCYTGEWQSENDNLAVVTEHAYIIGGDTEGIHPDPDKGEILIQDAVVIEKLF